MKRTQARTREERSVAESEPMMNLVSKIVPGSSTAPSSSASSSPGELKATSHCVGLLASTGRLVAEDSNENDAASKSQVWQTGAKLNASVERPAAVETDQNLNLLACTGRPVAWDSKIANIDLEWPHEYEISADSVLHMEKVYSKLWQRMGRKPGDRMDDLDKNSLIWRMFFVF